MEATTRRQLTEAQRHVLVFLRALEHMQQNILFQDVPRALNELGAASEGRLNLARDLLSGIDGADGDTTAVTTLDQALGLLERAQAALSGKTHWQEFAPAFMASRGYQREALEMIYRQRDTLETLEAYFRLPDAARCDARLADTATAPENTGVLHFPATSTHHNYSLYVPEYYAAEQSWPLVIALHGGYGRGDEYLMTWLRVARCRGYIVLSPKSIGTTWSIMQPAQDGGSIMAMLEHVTERYNVDPTRILVSGLSDGGTFGYLFGLTHHARFAALAPVAGVLSPTAEGLLRAGEGRELPLHVVHGVHDAIFAVQSARAATQLLKNLGYNLTYTELPDWGHAMTYAINENIVAPWFEEVSASE